MKKAWLNFLTFFKSIFTGIASLIASIVRGFFALLKSIYSAIASMYRSFVTFFKPKYSVIVSMYHVIPGKKVQKFDHKHEFGKGKIDEARMFYNSVIKKHATTKFPNTEILLIKGKKSVLHTKHFGPVTMVKSMNVA